MIVTPGTRRGVLALAVAIAAELASPAAEVGGGARVAPLQGELSIRDRALEAASSRNWPEAARQYRLAVEADPDSTTLRLDLGAALESVGDARGALAQYREALRLDSKLARADYRLGALLERAGRDQEAIEHYTAAVTQDPNFGAAHLKLADVLRRTDRLELAFSHYRRVMELEPATRRRTITGPEAEDARFGEAMALVRLTRFAEARDSLSMGIRVHPTQPAFRLALARVLAAAPDDLVRDGERAWELMGALLEGQQQPAVFETAAMALAELGHFDLAVDWQRLAMSAAANAGRSDVAQQMSANLALYVGRQPCRTPWRDDDPDHRPGPPVDLELLDRPAAR